MILKLVAKRPVKCESHGNEPTQQCAAYLKLAKQVPKDKYEIKVKKDVNQHSRCMDQSEAYYNKSLIKSAACIQMLLGHETWKIGENKAYNTEMSFMTQLFLEHGNTVFID